MDCKDILNLRSHIAKTHSSFVTSPEMVDAIDPLKHVKLTYLNRAKKADLTMSKLFGDRISSAHNQNAILIITGPMGMGKSNGAVNIATTTADYLAAKLGGERKDYFNIEDNVAIMKIGDIADIMRKLKKYNIYILDDIGASYGARDFNDKVNKNFNKVIQTFRDTNTLLILTTPNQGLIDKVAREISHYQIEMIQAIHHKGISIGKLSEIKKLYTGKTIYPFIVRDGVKYSRCVFRRMEPEMALAYEAKRKKAAAEIAQESIDVMMGTTPCKPRKEKPEPMYRKIIPEVIRLKTERPTMSIREIATELGIKEHSNVHKALRVYKLENQVNTIGE